jgi:[ribosomal protein S18]-alanine N-acetyltransferase
MKQSRNIRPFAAADVDQVLQLETPTPEAPHWERSAYESFLVPPEMKNVRHAAWVAFEGAGLVGFAAARLIVDICDLESIIVAENERGKGIGRALLDTITSWAIKQGGERMELEVRAGNARAIRFYTKAGLTREGLREGYYRHPPEDAVLMGKALKHKKKSDGGE